MISLQLSEEDGLAAQSFFCLSPCCPSSLPSLIPERGPLRDCERWEEMRGRVALLYTSAKGGIAFLLFVRGGNQFCSHHHVLTRRDIKCRYWETTGMVYSLSFIFSTLFISSVFFFLPPHNKIRVYCLAYPFSTSISLSLALPLPPFFFPSLWKGRKWSASLTSWHHISSLVLWDASLLFSCALW